MILCSPFSGFKLSSELQREMTKWKMIRGIVQTPKQLLISLLDENWRRFPMHVDVPANPQIFGSLVQQAGIEGILYPSKYNNRKCLAIFAQNFRSGASFVELEGVLPPALKVKRLDSSNYMDFK